MQAVTQLPNDPKEWLCELKLDGWRAIAYKSNGTVFIRSRNDKNFTHRFREISRALEALPDETVIDGEIVALDERGLPSFNKLQNSGLRSAPVVFYVFDVMMLAGKDVMSEPLWSRFAGAQDSPEAEGTDSIHLKLCRWSPVFCRKIILAILRFHSGLCWTIGWSVSSSTLEKLPLMS